MSAPTDLSKKNFTELKKLATELGIRGLSVFTAKDGGKEKITALIVANQAITGKPAEQLPITITVATLEPLPSMAMPNVFNPSTLPPIPGITSSSKPPTLTSLKEQAKKLGIPSSLVNKQTKATQPELERMISEALQGNIPVAPPSAGRTSASKSGKISMKDLKETAKSLGVKGYTKYTEAERETLEKLIEQAKSAGPSTLVAPGFVADVSELKLNPRGVTMGQALVIPPKGKGKAKAKDSDDDDDSDDDFEDDSDDEDDDDIDKAEAEVMEGMNREFGERFGEDKEITILGYFDPNVSEDDPEADIAGLTITFVSGPSIQDALKVGKIAGGAKMLVELVGNEFDLRF